VCGSDKLRSRGSGTERLEEELRVLFPQHEVTRVDADTTTRKGAHERMLSAFGNSPGHILLGTKMITKGLDFPLVTVVGVMDADSGLYFPDFRAVEETFQLITQVAGRAGRADLAGHVFIQTYNPANYAVSLAGEQDYDSFFSMESRMRRRMSYPPYGSMAVLHFRGNSLDRVRDSARNAQQILEQHSALTVLGPAPSFPERINNVYRWQVTLKCPERSALQQAFRDCQAAIVSGCAKGVHTYIMLD
jgi:primosomal protein N' (replication factor Y)